MLIYGSDPLLLETRAWVLGGAGFRTMCAANGTEVERMASREAVELLVLCHTLSDVQREHALEKLTEIRPSARRLVMTADGIGAGDEGAEPSVSAFDGPRALVASARRLLGTSMATLA